MRGKLTDKIKSYAMQLLGIELVTDELRLMPYIQFLAVNNQRVDPNKINSTERAILSNWKEKGWITGGSSESIEVSEEFWTAMSLIIFHAYVNK